MIGEQRAIPNAHDFELVEERNRVATAGRLYYQDLAKPKYWTWVESGAPASDLSRDLRDLREIVIQDLRELFAKPRSLAQWFDTFCLDYVLGQLQEAVISLERDARLTRIIGQNLTEWAGQELEEIIANVRRVKDEEDWAWQQSGRPKFIEAHIGPLNDQSDGDVSGGANAERLERFRDIVADLGNWLRRPQGRHPVSFALFMLTVDLVVEYNGGDRNVGNYLSVVVPETGGVITLAAEATLWYCHRLNQHLKSANPNGSIGTFEVKQGEVEDTQAERPSGEISRDRLARLTVFREKCRAEGFRATQCMIAVVANRRWTDRSHISKWSGGNHKNDELYDRKISAVLLMEPRAFLREYEKRQANAAAHEQ